MLSREHRLRDRSDDTFLMHSILLSVSCAVGCIQTLEDWQALCEATDAPLLPAR
jgi:hypothetical protein